MTRREPNSSVPLVVSHDGIMRGALRRQHSGVRRAALALIVLASIGLFSPYTSHAAPADDASSAEARVNNRIAQRLHNKSLGKDVSLVVIDAETQRIVASRLADKPMLPASNMKIVTAINTLSTMQPTQAFTTSVYGGSEL